jgi:hypothetical protein
MYVCVNGAGGDNELLAGDDFRGGTNDERRVNIGHDIWIPRLSDTCDAAVFNADIGLKGVQNRVEGK